MNSTSVLYAASIAVRLMLSLCLLSLIVCFSVLAMEIHGLQSRLDRRLSIEFRLGRDRLAAAAIVSTGILADEIAESRKESLRAANRQLSGLRFDLRQAAQRGTETAERVSNRSTESVVRALDRRLSETNRVLRDSLGEANKSIAEVARNTTLVAQPTAALVSQVNEASPLFMDCDHNENCLFNRWTGMAKGTEQMALAMGRHAEKNAQAVERISTSAARISEDAAMLADRYAKPRAWWKAIALAPLKWLRIDVRR